MSKTQSRTVIAHQFVSGNLFELMCAFVRAHQLGIVFAGF
jgi:hypothetical protein